MHIDLIPDQKPLDIRLLFFKSRHKTANEFLQNVSDLIQNKKGDSFEAVVTYDAKDIGGDQPMALLSDIVMGEDLFSQSISNIFKNNMISMDFEAVIPYSNDLEKCLAHNSTAHIELNCFFRNNYSLYLTALVDWEVGFGTGEYTLPFSGLKKVEPDSEEAKRIHAGVDRLYHKMLEEWKKGQIESKKNTDGNEIRISTQTAIKMLGVPRSTFYRYVNEGRLNRYYDDPENKRRSYHIESEIEDLKKKLAK